MIIDNGHLKKLNLIIRSLPDKPGVYQFLDEEETIIYIGKAKNLKKRVQSYFNKDILPTGKLATLVRKIADIRHLIVDTETDAFLLENNLIKKYQPRYNVMLKDDKTFPWICIKNEPFPRVFSTRNIIRDGSEYFGPYASGRIMHAMLDLIRQLFHVRTCNLNLSEKNIKARKFRVCLEYHIGNCKGPCDALVSAEEYTQMIGSIRDIIKGNITTVMQQLRKLMFDFAAEQAFEKAHLVKEKIEALEKFRSKSTIVNPAISDVDVFTIETDEKHGYVNYFKVVNGAIIQGHTVDLRKKLDESPEELLTFAITDFRQRFESQSKEILIPFKIDMEIPGVKFIVPSRGDKKKLLDLSLRNVKYYILEKEKQKELVDPERHTRRILEQMKKDLQLDAVPAHIECFDNSNIQGDYPVAAMVVFRNARPAKGEYRHFNIKTVEGPNDFASMEEVVFRRYRRLLDENTALPQLIIIDGGKGQLHSAMDSLHKLGLDKKISVIGIAKRLEELYFPDDPLPLYLDKKSETLRVIQHIRDEAHRFGITHHRNKRIRETVKTVLTDIPGIGYANSQTLLRKFKSVKAIREAVLDELQAAIGKAKGKIVYDYFQKEKKG